MYFRLEQFAGINNVDHPLKTMKVEYSEEMAVLNGNLIASVNYKLNKDGTASVRNGQTQKLAGINLKDLWVSNSGNISLFIDGTNIKKLNSNYSATNLYTVDYGRRMNFIEHNGVAYMGNTVQMLKYDGVSISEWGDDSDIPEEFEMPQRKYRKPPRSNILLSYRSRVYAADDRHVLFSEPLMPERFRRTNNFTVSEPVTALSHDLTGIYVFTLNTATYFGGLDPDDFTQMETQHIGAIKHGAIRIQNTPIIMTKDGWAVCESGSVKRLDDDNFRLNLSDTAEAYLGYNHITREVICNIRH